MFRIAMVVAACVVVSGCPSGHYAQTRITSELGGQGVEVGYVADGGMIGIGGTVYAETMEDPDLPQLYEIENYAAYDDDAWIDRGWSEHYVGSVDAHLGAEVAPHHWVVGVICVRVATEVHVEDYQYTDAVIERERRTMLQLQYGIEYRYALRGVLLAVGYRQTGEVCGGIGYVF
jgi:hypothetical protein